MVQLHFTSFNTESGYDIVRVYDGNDTTAPLLHTFSGTSRPSDVFSSGNTIFVSFVTDGSSTKDGFHIIFVTIILIPGKLQRFVCNSNDIKQWYLEMLLFPLNSLLRISSKTAQPIVLAHRPKPPNKLIVPGPVVCLDQILLLH